jgi:hypothetical protein
VAIVIVVPELAMLGWAPVIDIDGDMLDPELLIVIDGDMVILESETMTSPIVAPCACIGVSIVIAASMSSSTLYEAVACVALVPID